MILVDVHAHMDSKEFKDDLNQVIKKCKKEGVKIILTSGLDKTSNRNAIKLSKKYDIIKPILGIYPIDALSKECNEKIKYDINLEIEFIKENKSLIYGIGEVGLDFSNKDFCNKIEQKSLFGRMINLANELNKPLIVHSRKAEKEVLSTLKERNAKKVVLHCFMGKKNLIKEASERGYYFSVPPNIVRSHHFQNLVKIVNINQLLTETDSPYLGPFKNKRNDPTNIKFTIKEIANIKGFEEEDVANNIFMNYQKLFL